METSMLTRYLFFLFDEKSFLWDIRFGMGKGWGL